MAFVIAARQLATELSKNANRIEAHPISSTGNIDIFPEILLSTSVSVQNFSLLLNECMHNLNQRGIK